VLKQESVVKRKRNDHTGTFGKCCWQLKRVPEHQAQQVLPDSALLMPLSALSSSGMAPDFIISSQPIRTDLLYAFF
jgi:hypothetical protein